MAGIIMINPVMVLAVANKLSNLLIDEYTVFAGVVRHVEWIEKELRSMQGLLEQVDLRGDGEQEQALKDWAEKLKEIARDAEEVIETFVLKSVKRRRRGVLYWKDKYKVGKELEKICRRMRDISQTGINLNTTHGGEASSSSSSSTSVVAPAIEKLDHILSQTDNEVVERLKGELLDLQNIVYNLKSTSETDNMWLEEVKEVCNHAENVAEKFMERQSKMGRVIKKAFYLSAGYDLEHEFQYVRTHIGDAFRRSFTYGVGGQKLDKQTTPRSTPLENDPLSTLSFEKVFTNFVALVAWYAIILWSSDKNLKCVQRDLDLMDAFLRDTAESELGLNERQKVWVAQLKLVAQNSKSLLDAYSKTGCFMRFCRRFKFAVNINCLFKEILSISDSKNIYGVANIIQGTREELVVATTTSPIIHDEREIQREIEPPAPAASSYRRVTGLKEKVQSLREGMKLMDALFRDVLEMEGELDRRSRIWVEQMEGIFREALSVINDYVTKLEHKPFLTVLLNYRTRLLISNKIDDIRNQIEDASRRRMAYGLVDIQSLAVSSSSVVQDQIQSWPQTLETINTSLPLYLRRCLSYFGLFPADFGIPVRRLVVLWVAESLVLHAEHDQEPPELVAERYLTELIDRNMVQVASRKRNGKVKTCRIPNALRQLWLTDSNDSYFQQGRRDLNADPKKSIIRRVADHLNSGDIWHNHIHGDTTSPNSSSQLRTYYKDVVSFLSFDPREGSEPGQQIGNFLKGCISSDCFLLLRVLDLERVYKPKLPKRIKRLSRLRYLGLRWTYLDSLPSSISSLLKLQTLDLKHTYIHTLPTSIWKMELRHLFLSETYRTRFPHRPKGESLSDLQTLWGLFVDEETPVEGGLGNFLNIKKLGLACQSMSLKPATMITQLKAVADWIMKLNCLQSLRLKSRNEQGHPWYLILKPLVNHTNLTDIYLLGCLTSSHVLSSFPLSLVELTLSHSELEDDPMKILKDFPNLRTLCLLADSYLGQTMVCESQSFPQLHVLKFWMLEQFEEWRIEQGALPCLRQLEIRSCPRLKMPPEGLKHVKTTLLELKLTNMNMPREISAVLNNILPNVVETDFQ